MNRLIPPPTSRRFPWTLPAALGVLLSSTNALAQTDGPDPEALGGLFGSVMGTSIVFALGAVGIAALAILVVAIPWALQGGRNVWDQRSRRRSSKEAPWTPEQRAEFLRSRGQHA